MLDKGKTKLAKVLPHLPGTCRQDLAKLQDAGWECAFFLGVRDEKLIMCIAALKSRHQHIVFAADIQALVAELSAQIARQAAQEITD